MRWEIVLGLLALAIAARTGLARDAPPGLPPALPSSGPADLDSRLRALEEANRRLLEQQEQLLRLGEEDRRRADERYRELELRYDELRVQVERAGRSEEEAGPGAGEGTARPLFDEDEPGRIPSRPGSSDLPDPSPSIGREPLRSRLRAEFADGFGLGTDDGEVTLRLHLLEQTDFKVFTPNDQFPARSGLYIPRVRVYFEGRVTRPFEYEVSLQRSVDGVWDLLDANLNYRRSEAFQLRFGRSLVPYSYDWYDHLEPYFITPERGLFPLNFGIARSAGLTAHGDLFDGRLQYAAGGYDGRLIGLADNNITRDAVGYLNARPWLHSERRPALRDLNLGLSGFGGLQYLPEDPLPLRTSLQASENDEAARAASAIFLDWNPGTVALGGRSALAMHLAWYYRQLSVEAEWQVGRFDFARQDLPGRTTVPVHGYHTTFGYFLTGESIRERTTVVPLRPFDPRPGRGGGPGAIELFARYNQIDLGSEVFTADLADPISSTRHVSMLDLGFNWYPNQFIKFYVDYQLPFYGREILVDPIDGHYSRHGSMFWLRCQIWY